MRGHWVRVVWPVKDDRPAPRGSIAWRELRTDSRSSCERRRNPDDRGKLCNQILASRRLNVCFRYGFLGRLFKQIKGAKHIGCSLRTG